MRDLNMVENAINVQNTKTSPKKKGLNNIFLKTKKILRSEPSFKIKSKLAPKTNPKLDVKSDSKINSKSSGSKLPSKLLNKSHSKNNSKRRSKINFKKRPIIRSIKIAEKKLKFLEEKNENRFGARKKKKLFLNWPRDIFYNSRWLNKLMNKTMRHGKKGVAEKNMIQMLTLINQTVGGNSLLVFHQALNLVKPVLTVISRRVGRRIYQVPVPLPTLKQYKTSLKWLNLAAKKNNQMPIAETLATELIDTVFFKRSDILRKKADLYDTVVKNRAYTHYRWI